MLEGQPGLTCRGRAFYLANAFGLDILATDYLRAKCPTTEQLGKVTARIFLIMDFLDKIGVGLGQFVAHHSPSSARGGTALN